MGLLLGRLPQDDEELWMYCKVVCGMTVPRHAVCKHHKAPFDALADAYFGRSPVSVWKASRGFGGKSTLMGLLCVLEAATLGAQVTVWVDRLHSHSVYTKSLTNDGCMTMHLAVYWLAIQLNTRRSSTMGLGSLL